MTDTVWTCPSCSTAIPDDALQCPSCGSLAARLPGRAAGTLVAGLLQRHLAGRYRVERELGEGGMAVVYLAHDLKHGRNVAIKVLRPDVSALLGAERFLREISIAARLNHPGIVALHDSGEAGGLLYYVMPYEEGQTLRARLGSGTPLPLNEALHIAQDVAEALAYAHAQHVVHRDIKPENILLTAQGHATIADFGIARALAGAQTTWSSRPGPLGTPAYMSPEQITGEGEVGPATDIYALGCVLYEMLTGAMPFGGDDPRAVMNRHCTAPLPSARERRRDVPLAVDLAVRRAMAKDPAQRFAGAGEFGAALAAPQLDFRGVLRAARHWLRRRSVAVVAAALTLAGLVLLWAPWRASDGRATAPLRLGLLHFEPADSSLRGAADRLAGALSDDLSIVPDLSVVRGAPGRRGAATLRQRLAELDADQVAIITLSRDTVVRATLRLVDARSSRPLGEASAVTTAGGDAALVRRFSMFVRRALVARRDSLERRTLFRREDAWRRFEEARAQLGVAEQALAAGADRVAVTTIARSDSLARVAIALEPGSVGGLILLAGNFDRRAFFLEFLRQTRPDTAAWLRDAMSLRLAAVALLDSALAREPGNALALQLRGSVKGALLRVGGPDSLLAGAIRDLGRATELDERRARAWSELALLYGQDGSFSDELFAYEQALRADPFQAYRETYLRGTFDAALKAGELARAGEACRTGLREYPASTRFQGCELQHLSRAAATAPDAARAVALADSLDRVESNPTSRAMQRLWAAAALALAGRGAEADRQAHQVEGLLSGPALNDIVLIEMGRVRQLRHDRDSAKALIGRALAIQPGARRTLLNRPEFASLRAWLTDSLPVPAPPAR